MAQERLILASSSVYRRELLQRLGIAFKTASPDVDETPLAGETPLALSQRLARLKAQAIAKANPGMIVIGSDQVCELEGAALGKPHTYEKAKAQLAAMQGKTAVFHTALCVIDAAGHVFEDVSDTFVTMRPLSEEAIDEYLTREKPFDCAGSAKIERLGIALMQKVQSDDPTSLIGLPLMKLTTLLVKSGLSPLKGL